MHVLLLDGCMTEMAISGTTEMGWSDRADAVCHNQHRDNSTGPAQAIECGALVHKSVASDQNRCGSRTQVVNYGPWRGWQRKTEILSILPS